jgi:hypothetical protein
MVVPYSQHSEPVLRSLPLLWLLYQVPEPFPSLHQTWTIFDAQRLGVLQQISGGRDEFFW